jgi:pimeloyl-ACP methyl ester carboxylesterase
MPIVSVNGVDLYYEEFGQGEPLVFSHEFAGDYRSWEPQVRFFARRYRTIVYNARGYPPSEVPDDQTAYGEEQLVEDLYQLIGSLGIERAHVCGLSMGGAVALKLGIDHPEVCRSLVVAGAGSGSEDREAWAETARATADQFERDGAEATAEVYGRAATRLRLEQKDPHGFAEFMTQFKEHSALGSARTMRGVQARRRSIYDVADQLPGMNVPTLILVGDEDEPCLEPSLFMKRRLPNAGLVTFARTGHVINLEEPALFNQTVLDFLTAVEQGRWLPHPETST